VKSASEHIAVAAAKARRWRQELGLRLAMHCPGPHGYVQHRDHKPPWCPKCGYTADGDLVGAPREERP
jgi:hypothetical protein